MRKYLLIYSDSYYKIKFEDGNLNYTDICDDDNHPLSIIELTDELINDISKLKNDDEHDYVEEVWEYIR